MRGRLINDRPTDDRLINDARQHLIVALDVSSAAAARKIVAAVGDSASTYKVGMQLYTAEGPQIVRQLVTSGRRIFLDLKNHDIPNTVASAIREAAKLGVSMLTVHASGGSKMLRAAVDAAASVNPELMVLGVTVLTSMDENDLEETGARRKVLDQVLRLAELAIRSGCQGIVTSARPRNRSRAKPPGPQVRDRKSRNQACGRRSRRSEPRRHSRRGNRRRRNAHRSRKTDYRSSESRRRSGKNSAGDERRRRRALKFRGGD